MLAPFVLLLVSSLALFPVQRSTARTESRPLTLAGSPEAAADPLAEAERARQNGDTDTAAGIYRSLLEQSDRGVAEDARVRLAGLDLARGDLTDAAAQMEPLAVSDMPLLRERASFLLAEVARARKDCSRATPLYQSLVSSDALLAPYAGLGLLQCAEAAGDAEAMARHAQALLDTEPHRRLRIEILEKLAAAELKRGNTDRALQIHDELFNLGATRSYRGTELYNAAEVARSAGYQDLAVRKLSALVREYPEHPRALTALETLNAQRESEAITWTQAALVRLNARQDAAAKTGFDTALADSPGGPEAATARYYRATLTLRQGRELEAAREMRAAAELDSAGAIAPMALLRAGRIVESNDGFDEAREIYGRLTSAYPDTTQGRTARFRLGLLQYLRGDRAGAIGAWEALAADANERDLQALALQWQGKAYRELGDQTTGDARLQHAVEMGPDTFGGMRAAAIGRGDASAQHTFQALSATPARPDNEDPDLDAWLTSQGSNRAELADALSSDPMYRRAQELTRLGLRDQAMWELDGLAERASQETKSLPRQFLLAATEMSLGYTSQSLRTAESAVRDRRLVRTDLPAAFQRLLMPLAFRDSLAAGANRYSADGLLLAAIVRQESRFDPMAKSPANALGLSQIVPSTGQTMATALGYPNFNESDLFKPAVSLDLGAYYLAQQLNRYGGSILPALAAYNAGGGAVDKWLKEFGTSDVDVFAARIPYSETTLYLHVVYENYGMYQRLYRGE